MKKPIRAIILVSTSLALIGCVAQNKSPTKEVGGLCEESRQTGSAQRAAGADNAPDLSSSAPLSQKAATTRQVDSGYSPQTAYTSGDDSLNRLQDFFRSTLEANEKSFQGRSGFVKGFGAGRGYPQIWLRDSATIIPASRYYYSAEYLTTWLEEHLAYQREDGSLNDWIASGRAANFLKDAPKVREVSWPGAKNVADQTIVISADKNTTEADKETSAVDAAYQVFRITGDRNWLSKNINGRALLKRLDLALEYLLKSRFDFEHGLVSNAFTADWGDVGPLYPDQRAIYLDEKTPLVVGLYTNVLFYRAAEQLREIYTSLAQPSRADYWQKKASMIKESINKHLWQRDKGFYRIHLTLTSSTSSRAEGWHGDSDIFAMGGNALAVLYAVADDDQARKIFEVAEQRQRALGFSTIAGVLLPSYPKGFFKHPAVSEEYSYQNGGQWDWFAGRFLLAEFERGYSARAYRQLIEIGEKAVANKGLHEWHTKDGTGMGSSDYAGSAGSLAAAIFQGLYGVYLSNETLNLKIRLGDQPGQIHLYQPATDKYIAYRYCYREASETVRMVYESNIPGTGEMCLLLPKNRQPRELKIDGEKRALIKEMKGEDAYVCFSTDWKPHQLELKAEN